MSCALRRDGGACGHSRGPFHGIPTTCYRLRASANRTKPRIIWRLSAQHLQRCARRATDRCVVAVVEQRLEASMRCNFQKAKAPAVPGLRIAERQEILSAESIVEADFCALHRELVV